MAASRKMSTAPVHSAPGIHLFTVGTPNGLKVSVALEELKALGAEVPPYTTHKINFGTNEQKEPWFLEINPNGRIPAIIDNERNGKKVWETGSILLYLAKYYDKSYKLHFEDEDDETDMLNWIFFQHGGLGPMQGQAGHFLNAAPEKIKYGAKRYIDETKRLFSVYEAQLQDRDYLVGPGRGKFSLADIVSFTWVRAVPFSLGVPTVAEAGFPELQKWVDRIEAREGTANALGEDGISQLKKKENWEDETRKKVEWVYAGDERKKDEL
ncbi:Glutathione S-transferase [Pseudohyphozyma bogoriensis]|nr:Glutathione S-transferase [Pseudohyphozyma bogoriensis]